MVSNKKIVTLVLITVVGLAMTGCSDSDTAAVLAPAVIDTAPPAIPTNLDSEFSGGNATLTWSANTDLDLAAYVVVREHYGSSEDLASVSKTATSYVDSSPLAGNSAYHVYAVDTSGNQSAVSTTYLSVSVGSGNRNPEIAD